MGTMPMKINRLGHAAAVMSLSACFCAVAAFGAGSAYPRSADEAIARALASVKSRYRAKLDHYGLPNRTSMRRAEYAT